MVLFRCLRLLVALVGGLTAANVFGQATPVGLESAPLAGPSRDGVRAAAEPGASFASAADVFSGYRELPLEVFVDTVVATHPTSAAAFAAWRAAAARYPQVIALDDPMLDFMTAPASIGTDEVDFAYVVQGRQKVPWFGKRRLRGDAARHQANAALHDSLDVRLQLTEAAAAAYYEYFTATRRWELNQANREAVRRLRNNALDRYQTGLVTQQDVLLADVELGETERRDAELQRAVRVARARINTLLLRDPDAPLPPPPRRTPGLRGTVEATLLRELALSQRPDVGAALARVRAEQTNIALAYKEYRPDLEFVGRYDTFWLPHDRLVGTVGVTLNVPIQIGRRDAAVRQASAETAEKRAEFDRLRAQVQFEVHEAYERVEESRRVVLLFEERLIPAARSSVEGAGAAYETGKLDFLRLVEAQRQLIDLQMEQIEAVGEYQIRWTALERAVGGPLPEKLPPSDSAEPLAAP